MTDAAGEGGSTSTAMTGAHAPRPPLDAWVVGAVVLSVGTLWLSLAALPNALAVSRAGDFELTVRANGQVTGAAPSWGGLRPGDRVVAVDGVPYPPSRITWVVYRHPPGLMALRVERGGESHAFSRESALRSTLWRSSVFVRPLLGLLLTAIGLAAAVLRAGSTVGRLFHLFCTGVGFFLVTTLSTDDYSLGSRLEVAVLPFASSLGLHLFATFPVPAPWFRARPARAWVLYVLPTLLVPAYQAVYVAD